MSGEDSCIDDVISTSDEKKVSLVEDEKQVKENRKRQTNIETENKVGFLYLHFLCYILIKFLCDDNEEKLVTNC